MKLRNAFLAATVFAAPVALSHAAKAQPITGPYVSLGAGFNWEQPQKTKNIFLGGEGANVTGYNSSSKITTHNGWTGEGSFGWGLGDGFRLEIEGDYYENRFDKSKGTPVGGTASGKEQRYGLFTNALYDFDIGLPWMFPYVGGGLGYQEDAFNDFSGAGINTNKTKGAFAYQGIAGVAFPIAPLPGLSATVEYRFMGLAGSRKFNGEYDGTGGYAPGGSSAAFKAEHEYNNSVMLGLRYAFDTRPPAPPATPAPAAAPAPAPAKTYLVFFDWDKYNLTPRATQIIAQAASDSHTQQVTTINVSGYTDTSGTAQYNQGLSQRRAQAVASQLVSDGVSQSEISIHAYGDTHLLVPTGPGVREPQNRRVEIVLD